MSNNDGIVIHDYGQQVDENEKIARKQLADQGHTEVMSTAQAQERYRFLSFGAPFVDVERKSDGVRGYLQFTHSPRLYFGFTEEK